MMKRWKMIPAAMLTAAMTFGTLALRAEDAPDKMPPPPSEGEMAPQAPQGQRGPQQGQRGPRGPRMGREINPEMLMAMMVRKELKAYQATPNDETYAALEKALADAQARRKAELAKRIEKLQEELKNFDAKQGEAGKAFLEKVKKGEFKMPERPPMPPNGQGAPRGQRQEGELPPPPPPEF